MAWEVKSTSAEPVHNCWGVRYGQRGAWACWPRLALAQHCGIT